MTQMRELFVNYWWQLISVAVACYLIGGINFAILFTKAIKHEDIRQKGSGNAGTTNVFRVFGLRMGALTFLCDALKGVVVCVACLLIFKSTNRALDFEYWAGIFVVLGHIFSVYNNFRGGKGVATSIGVCFVLHPILMLCCVIPICAVIFIVDRMSVMSLLFSVFMIVWHWTVLRESVGISACVFITIMFAFVIFAHRHNIVRIFTGKELRTGVRRKILRKDKKEARLLREAEERKMQELQAEETDEQETQTDEGGAEEKTAPKDE